MVVVDYDDDVDDVSIVDVDVVAEFSIVVVVVVYVVVEAAVFCCCIFCC